jgi:CheY-like chemotaxis protein
MKNTPNSIALIHALIVDDDPFMLELTEEMLQQLGVQIISRAQNGQDALTRFEQGKSRPNLILIDLHMPNKDGFQLMEAISQHGYDGAVIIVSGQTSRVLHSAELMAQFHRLNILGTLEKPVKREALLQTINKMW